MRSAADRPGVHLARRLPNALLAAQGVLEQLSRRSHRPPAGNGRGLCRRTCRFPDWPGRASNRRGVGAKTRNQYGTNDFRSTKMNIFEASLLSAEGNGVRVLSDGSQHVRSWVDGRSCGCWSADYANEGAAAVLQRTRRAASPAASRLGSRRHCAARHAVSVGHAASRIGKGPATAAVSEIRFALKVKAVVNSVVDDDVTERPICRRLS